MCGIVGYVGNKIASTYVLKSLKFLDYRGYDSAGVGFLNNGKLEITKVVGSVENLSKKLKQNVVDSSIMIGHTRWATHGGVNIKNAHPQTDNANKIAVVHNGIIENYEVLKKELEKKGVCFSSQTDTEIIPNLLHIYLKNVELTTQNILFALSAITKRLVGTYALCVIFENINQIFVCSRFSPLVVCKFDGGAMVSSDLNCLPDDDCFKLTDNTFAVLDGSKIEFFDEFLNQISLRKIKKPKTQFKDDSGKFGSFMEKEIFEDGEAVASTINFLDFNSICDDVVINKESHLFITACGTAYHAGRVFQYILKKICKLESYINYASEFRYSPPFVKKDDVCFFISQSGETADTLSCLKLAQSLEAKTVAITNVQTSTIADLADKNIPTNAGIERAVASTKAFVAQLAVCYFLTLKFAEQLSIDCEFSKEDILFQQKALDELQIENLSKIVDELKDLSSIYVLGRGLDYVSAMEGALKIKEVSYIHCEAIPLGELKHGSIALFNNSTYCFVVMTDKTLFPKVKNNISEIKSRGAKIILITNCEEKLDVNHTIKINTEDILSPFVVSKVFQLFALNISRKKHINVDKPRNLAKSVTVE